MAFFISVGTYGEARQGFLLLGQPRRLSLREHPFGGVAAGADAIGDPDATIGVAGKSEAGQVVA